MDEDAAAKISSYHTLNPEHHQNISDAGLTSTAGVIPKHVIDSVQERAAKKRNSHPLRHPTLTENASTEELLQNGIIVLGPVKDASEMVLTYDVDRAIETLEDAIIGCYYAFQDVKILACTLWLLRWPILVFSLLNQGIWLSVFMLFGLLFIEPPILIISWFRREPILIRGAIWLAAISAVVKIGYLIAWAIVDWGPVSQLWWWIIASLLLVHIILTAFPIWIPSLLKALVNLAACCLAFATVYWQTVRISEEGYNPINQKPPDHPLKPKTTTHNNKRENKMATNTKISPKSPLVTDTSGKPERKVRVSDYNSGSTEIITMNIATELHDKNNNNATVVNAHQKAFSVKVAPHKTTQIHDPVNYPYDNKKDE